VLSGQRCGGIDRRPCQALTKRKCGSENVYLFSFYGTSVSRVKRENRVGPEIAISGSGSI